MYFYIYDEITAHSRHEREMRLIENRLTDLDITGKIGRLSLFRDPTKFIKDAVKFGAKTIIAVGNDITLRKVIEAVGSSEVVIGVIPLTKDNNEIAGILGIPIGAGACEILSKRIVEKLDIGIVSGMRFLHTAQIKTSETMEIICDDWSISPPQKSIIEIRNMTHEDDYARAANPTDGKVDLVVKSGSKGLFKKENKATLIPVKKALITSQSTVDLHIDGEAFEGERFEISVKPGKISVITGEGREF